MNVCVPTQREQQYQSASCFRFSSGLILTVQFRVECRRFSDLESAHGCVRTNTSKQQYQPASCFRFSSGLSDVGLAIQRVFINVCVPAQREQQYQSASCSNHTCLRDYTCA